MADICDQIVRENPDIQPSDFLVELGALVAGIEPGFGGIVDLARGGENKIWGAGFRPEFDDGSNGQARHFAGVAAAVERFGPETTEFAAHTFLDKSASADGKLSTTAIDFATLVLSTDLAVDDTGNWIRAEICNDVQMTEGV